MRATRRLRVTLPCLLVSSAALVGGSLLWASPAGAGLDHQVSLTGCHGTAVARDGGGEIVSEARGEPPADVTDAAGQTTFTAENPFRVSANGTVEWQGGSTVVLVDQSWKVETWGWTLDEGTAANQERRHEDASGIYELSRAVPLKSPGLYRISVETVSADGSVCGGTGFVKVVGSPLLTPAWALALLLVGAGAGLLYFGQPKRIWVEAPQPEEPEPFVREDDEWEYVDEDEIDPDDDTWEYADEDD